MATIHHEPDGDWFTDEVEADDAVGAHREIERVVRDAGWEPDPRDRRVIRESDGLYAIRVRVSRRQA
jgi:hypothetical protein